MSTSYFDPNDPAFAALIDIFVSELPERIESIESAVATGDIATLRRIGHQLKGSSASYGFDSLTQPAYALQHACDESREEQTIADAANHLANACRKAVAGHQSLQGSAEG